MSQNYEYFGKYILLEKLATGGMAEVWLARAPGAGGIGKFVAIKKILPQYSDNPEFIQMFKDEAAIAMNLAHGNIVSIYEFGQEKNQLFLVMDYVEGRNLRQILNKMKSSQHKFSIDQIIYMSKEVAAGLDHAHRSLNSATGKPLNITHRDISPQNVMVTFEGEVKIVDFGIAKAESQLENTRTGTLKGKFGYMSPEQAEGQTADLRTDIFSLGIVLWELIANDRLFIANNELNTLKKIRECNVPSLTKLNPTINPELERIVMKALTRDRNLRYQTAAAMHRDLNRFLNRQYPDFTPHDFSVFIKTLYTDEILDIRKRLIDYAKIPFRPVTVRSDEGDRTSVTSFPQAQERTKSNVSVAKGRTAADGKAPGEATVTATETFSDSASASNPSQNNVSDNSTPSGITLSQSDTNPGLQQPPASTGTKSSISLINKPTKPNLLDQQALNNNLHQQIVIKPKQPQTLHRDDDSGVHGDALGIENTQEARAAGGARGSRAPKRAAKPKRASNSSFSLMLMVALAIASYMVVSTFWPKQTAELEIMVKQLIFNTRSTQTPLVINPSPPAGDPSAGGNPSDTSKNPPMLADFSSTAGLVVNSVPSGAEIYINGLNTGKTTPSRVEIPADRPFTIDLKLDRYIDYTKTNLTSEHTGRSFTATLQKSMVAYLDIDVKPARNARVYVNGQALTDENLPITRYAVPSGTQIKIRAENPYTGTSAEETLILKEDQRKSLLLRLDQTRKPSGK